MRGPQLCRGFPQAAHQVGSHASTPSSVSHCSPYLIAPASRMDASATPFSRRSSRRLHGVPALSQPLPTAMPSSSVQAGAVAAVAGAAAAALGAGVPPPADGHSTTLDTLPAWALTAILWRLLLRARAALGATCCSLYAAVGDAVPLALAVGVFQAVPLAVAPAVDATGGSARSGWGDPPSKRQRLTSGGAAAPRWKLMNHVVTRVAVVVQGTATLAVLAGSMRCIPDPANREEMRRQLDGIVTWMEEKGDRIASLGGGRCWASAGDTFSSVEGSDEDGFLSSSDDRRRLHDIIRSPPPAVHYSTCFCCQRPCAASTTGTPWPGAGTPSFFTFAVAAAVDVAAGSRCGGRGGRRSR